MIVLGLAGGLGHDASAALVIDGKLASLAEEERFTRVRHAPGQLPVESVAYCLATAGITIADVDVLATSWINADRDDVQRDMRDNLFQHPYFAGSPQPPWERVRHPLAHATASYVTSGFEDAAIISVDGVGDSISTMVGHGRAGRVEVKREYRINDSLGLFYLGLTNFLGFRFGQEGKVMGLASYGSPDRSWMPFTLDDEGYRSGVGPPDPDRPNFGPPIIREWKRRLADHFGPARPASFTFSPRTARLSPFVEPDPWRQHVAATGQHVLERVLLHIVADAIRETGCRTVVIGGGVGYNCTANGAIWRSGLVDRLAVFPASGDAGTSAGAALTVAAEAGERDVRPLATAALGPEFDHDVVRSTLRATGVAFREEDDIAAAVADLLVDGKVVAWFQGCAEAGPRALGQRSILASPLTRAMHERVNAIKSREQWRPLAPSLSIGAAGTYLENPGPIQFMLSACQVKDAARDQVPAVVHVDGSCRPQVLDDGASPLYRRLMGSLADRGHPEIVLNTSFNLANEPIVHSPVDALRSFYGSGLDALAIGPALVHKSPR